MQKLLNKLQSLPQKAKIIFGIVSLVIIGLIAYQTVKPKTTNISYQTATVTKSDLIVSTSATGTISSGNSTDISTKVSGVVSQVFVSNGDKVTKGQRIARLTLDEYGQERQASAYAAYIDAKVAVKTAEAAKDEADIQMWTDRNAIFTAIDNIDYKNDNSTNPDTKKTYTDSEKMIIDKTLEKNRKVFTASELKYQTADAAINKAKAQVVSSWKDYQQASAVIVAPATGAVSNLALAVGTVITTTTNTNSASNAVTAQNIGKIIDVSGSYQATVNLSEIDIIGIKANQKVILTLDTYPDKTFTGKVLAVNTSGSVSSGVTTYPVTILLDPTTVEIYTNMAVTAEIVKNIVTNVIQVPVSAISTNGNGESTVEVMKNRQPATVSVELGVSNDSQTEITSGLNEGDVVIVSTINNKQQTTNTTEASPFSGLSRGGASGNRMIIREGGPPGF